MSRSAGCSTTALSGGGSPRRHARCRLQTPSWLPYNFVLTIEATRFVSWCEVRHHKQDSVGVRFMSAIESASLDPRGASEGRSMDDKDAWAGDYR